MTSTAGDENMIALGIYIVKGKRIEICNLSVVPDVCPVCENSKP